MKHLVNVKVTMVCIATVVVNGAEKLGSYEKDKLIEDCEAGDLPMFRAEHDTKTVRTYENLEALTSHMVEDPSAFSGLEDVDVEVTFNNDKEYLRSVTACMSRYEGGEGI